MTRRPRVMVLSHASGVSVPMWWWQCDGCDSDTFGRWALSVSRAHDAARAHARVCLPLRYNQLVARLEAESTEALLRAGVWNRASENAQQFGTAMRLSAMAYATTGMVSRLHAIISEATR